MRALCDKLSVRRLGKSLVRRGIIDSLVRGGVVSPELATETDTVSPNPQPSRSSSSRLGRSISPVSQEEGKKKDRSILRLVRINTFSVCAKGRVTISESGSVGVGSAMLAAVGERPEEKEDEGDASENARA